MISPTQIKMLKFLHSIAVLAFKLLSRKVLFIIEKTIETVTK